MNRLRRERAWLLRGAKARTTKQKARIKRAEALIAIEAPREVPRVELEGLETSARPSGKSVLELHDLRLDLGGRTLIAGLTLYLVQGERVGVVGPNGVGKTSLLKLVSGELAPTGGETKLGARTRIAYFDQARADLRDDWSVFDNVAGREGAQQSGGGHVQLGDTTLELRAYLERFLFDGGKQRQKVLGLSGGERARVALAKALRDGANLLLLDEPTNDLDVSTLAELEELLVGWPGCALVVSHDRAFLDRVATCMLAFEGGGAVVRYQGNYQSYLAQRERAVQVETRDARKPQPARADARAQSSPPPDLTRKALTYAERLELAGIVDAIAAAESDLARREAALSDPAIYTASADAQKGARSSYEQARAEVMRLTTRWEALEARAAVSKS
jgi:ABC transport system ATP-binding/permease protein